MFCVTTCKRADWDGAEIGGKKKIVYLLGGGVLLAALWSLSGTIDVKFLFICTLVVVFVIIAEILPASKCSGKDYFIGTEGFATVEFVKGRGNITDETITRFSDISQLVSYESNYRITDVQLRHRVRVDGERDYEFTFLTKPTADGTMRYARLAFGTHNQCLPSGDPVNAEYKLYKNLELYWTKLKLDEMDANPYDNDISFSRPREEPLPNNPKMLGFFPTWEILARPEGLIVGDRLFNDKNVKKVKITDAHIILQLTDDAVAPGQKGSINIPWENVANDLLLLIWIHRLFPVVENNSIDVTRKYKAQLKNLGVIISW